MVLIRNGSLTSYMDRTTTLIFSITVEAESESGIPGNRLQCNVHKYFLIARSKVVTKS